MSIEWAKTGADVRTSIVVHSPHAHWQLLLPAALPDPQPPRRFWGRIMPKWHMRIDQRDSPCGKGAARLGRESGDATMPARVFHSTPILGSGGRHPQGRAWPGDGEASPIMPPSPMAAARGIAHEPEAKKPELDAAA